MNFTLLTSNRILLLIGLIVFMFADNLLLTLSRPIGSALFLQDIIFQFVSQSGIGQLGFKCVAFSDCPLWYYPQHVRRPKGGLNFWLRWLPVPVHKKVNYLLQHVQANWLRVPLSRLLKGNDVEPRPSSAERQSPLMSSGAYGLRALALDDRTVPEADAGRIAALAREDVDRLNFFLSFLIFLVLGIVY